MNELKHLKTFESFSNNEGEIIEEGLFNYVPSEKNFKAKMAQYKEEKGEDGDPYQIAATYKLGLKNKLRPGGKKHWFAVKNKDGAWVSPVKYSNIGSNGVGAGNNDAAKGVENSTLKKEFLKDGIDLDSIA